MLNPTDLYNEYVESLKLNCKRKAKHSKKLYLERISLREFNFNIFTDLGIDKKMQVNCNGVTKKKIKEYKDKKCNLFSPHEYLWDLCWIRERTRTGKLMLTLEQEMYDKLGTQYSCICNDDKNKDKGFYCAAFHDFTKVLLPHQQECGVFIGTCDLNDNDRVSKIINCFSIYYNYMAKNTGLEILVILVIEDKHKPKELDIHGWKTDKNRFVEIDKPLHIYGKL